MPAGLSQPAIWQSEVISHCVWHRWVKVGSTQLLAEVGLMGLPNRHMLQTTKDKEGGGHLIECCKARVQPEVIIWTQGPSRTEVWS